MRRPGFAYDVDSEMILLEAGSVEDDWRDYTILSRPADQYGDQVRQAIGGTTLDTLFADRIAL